MLKIEHLTKLYGEKKAVDDLSLHIRPGEIYGFIGHNGAGKTTTIKSCAGILQFEQGEIIIDGKSVKADIQEDGDNFVLEADLPGFKKEDIHVDVADDRLTVSAERHSNYEDKDKKGNYLRCERSYGSYARSFDISGIDAAGIKAAYADGVLRVTLPKQKEVPASSRRLEIE